MTVAQPWEFIYCNLSKAHDHVVSTFSVQRSHESCDNFMPGSLISGFRLEVQSPLIKMP